jgi:hypothetical protein
MLTQYHQIRDLDKRIIGMSFSHQVLVLEPRLLNQFTVDTDERLLSRHTFILILMSIVYLQRGLLTMRGLNTWCL